MTTVLQIGNRTITSEEIIPLLVGYRIIPQLLCESIIDRAIVPIHCTSEETVCAYQEFDRCWGFTSKIERDAWRKQYGLSQEQLEELVTRRLKVEKFKQETWGRKLGSDFLKHKNQLDLVIYSLLRTQDQGLANELYFRIQEGEQSFAELARQYSEGPEAETGGMMGPVELGTLHPQLAWLLHTSQVGVLQLPVSLGEWQVIVRVEKLIPAQLDEFMRQRLLQENFEAWFQEQLKQLSGQDRIWMGVTVKERVDITNEPVAA